jgi:hypothetical protein
LGNVAQENARSEHGIRGDVVEFISNYDARPTAMRCPHGETQTVRADSRHFCALRFFVRAFSFGKTSVSFQFQQLINS